MKKLLFFFLGSYISFYKKKKKEAPSILVLSLLRYILTV